MLHSVQVHGVLLSEKSLEELNVWRAFLDTNQLTTHITR